MRLEPSRGVRLTSGMTRSLGWGIKQDLARSTPGISWLIPPGKGEKEPQAWLSSASGGWGSGKSARGRVRGDPGKTLCLPLWKNGSRSRPWPEGTQPRAAQLSHYPWCILALHLGPTGCVILPLAIVRVCSSTEMVKACTPDPYEKGLAVIVAHHF